MTKGGRRSFLQRTVNAGAALAGLASIQSKEALADVLPGPSNALTAASELAPPPFRLGLVTYELAKDWNIETIIKNCEDAGFEGVELRTTHKHGVEPSLSKSRRAEVRKRFDWRRTSVQWA